MSKPKPPAKVNNFKVNKPVVAKPRVTQPTIYIKPRNVEEVKPVVNAKVADEKLIHKPKKKQAPKPPVIVKGGKGGQKRSTRQGSKQSERSSKKESPSKDAPRRRGSV